MKTLSSLVCAGILLLLLGGCSGKTIQMYTLQSTGTPPQVHPRYSAIRVDYPKGIEDTMGTRIYFSRSDLTQSYYSYSQWGQSLNRILMANLIEALQRSGIARNVLDYASQADAPYELESTVYRFEHHITPQGSSAEVAIGLRLIRAEDKRLIASKIFHYSVPCTQTDAKGFVEAANRAITRLSADMVRWLSGVRR
jgi:cholesterol transport system auxiliary component